MRLQLRPALVMLLLLTLITGVLYPLVVTVFAQVVMPAQANGSLITRDDVIIGSSLIGQANSQPGDFWPRPSAIAYNPLPSSGSNLGPTSAQLLSQVAERAAAFREANGLGTDAPVPADMLYASGSGLDPHISPEAARLQVARVARERDLPPEVVAALVESSIEQPQFGLLGEPRVNVLLLNEALDRLES